MVRPLLKRLLIEAFRELYPKVEAVAFTVEVTPPEVGADYATNLPFVASSLVGEPPQKIAEKLIAVMPAADFIDQIEVAGPGFLNFHLGERWLQKQVATILRAGERFGNADTGRGLSVLLEYISANPTGPLTLGNGRGGFFGDALANVLKTQGFRVRREYYVNDVGSQVETLGTSLLAAAGRSKPTKEETLYRGAYYDRLAGQVALDGPAEVGRRAAKLILEREIKPTLERLHLRFDRFQSEAELVDRGKLGELLTMLEKRGLSYKKEGALWFRTSKFWGEKDDVLIRADGEHTYFASDLVYHAQKISRGFEFLIDIMGADHAGHKPRLEAAVSEVIGPELNFSGRLIILITQLVRLVEAGKPARMGKRLGRVVTLEELVDEVGEDVARWFFLERDLGTHMDFDLALARQRSEKNPVYFVQYAHARIASIFRKRKVERLRPSPRILCLLSKDEELSLIRHLIRFPDLMATISENFHLHTLPHYLVGLADRFHRFYERHRVISEDDLLTEGRLALCAATKLILRKGLNLLGISAPEKM